MQVEDTRYLGIAAAKIKLEIFSLRVTGICILILHVAWYWISSGLRFVDIRACLISLVC
jgi:hypothetical protein